MQVDSVIDSAGNDAGIVDASRKEVKPRDFQDVAPGDGKRLALRPVELNLEALGFSVTRITDETDNPARLIVRRSLAHQLYSKSRPLQTNEIPTF